MSAFTHRDISHSRGDVRITTRAQTPCNELGEDRYLDGHAGFCQNLTKESSRPGRGVFSLTGQYSLLCSTLLHCLWSKPSFYTPKLLLPPPPGSDIQALHRLVDSYCPLRCHLAKLYIYLQAALLIFSHKSVPPVV